MKSFYPLILLKVLSLVKLSASCMMSLNGTSSSRCSPTILAMARFCSARRSFSGRGRVSTFVVSRLFLIVAVTVVTTFLSDSDELGLFRFPSSFVWSRVAILFIHTSSISMLLYDGPVTDCFLHAVFRGATSADGPFKGYDADYDGLLII